MKTETYQDHKHYELCKRAHYNTSFSPEKRAETNCREFDARQAELKELGASAATIEKSERLFVAWMSAKANCLSSMITGPARFPTAKAERANQTEHNRLTEYLEHFEKVAKAIKREKYFEANPEKRPISSSDNDATERLKAKLAGMEEERKRNNAINKIVRQAPRGEISEKKIEQMKQLGLGENLITELFKPNFCGGVGIPAYVNQNLGGNIKRVKGRIAEIEKTKDIKTEQIDLGNDISVTQDTDAMRVYFEFPGKPDDETRSLLKSKGFRWTPSQGHWGRKLTGNASHAARQVMQAIKLQVA